MELSREDWDEILDRPGTPQSARNFLVVDAVNSGPPSVVRSSGMPKVTKMDLKLEMRPVAPLVERSTMGHPEKQSTITT